MKVWLASILNRKRRTPGKCVCGKPYREFESRLLRHLFCPRFSAALQNRVSAEALAKAGLAQYAEFQSHPNGH